MKKTLMFALLMAVIALPALAQEAPRVPVAPGTISGDTETPGAAAVAPATATQLPDRFQIDTGYFRLNSKTVLWLNTGSGIKADVNFENDLGIKPNINTFWVDTTWRLGRRHQVKLSLTKISRENSKTLGRTFTWNDKTYAAGLSATGTLATTLTSGYYRYALFRNDRFEAGPAIGIGYLKISAGIKATGTITLPDSGTQTASLDESGSTGSITGDVGAYFNAWPNKHVAVRGDFLYIKVTLGQTTSSVTDGRLALDVYPWTQVGFGVQYKYNKYRSEKKVREAGLGGQLTYSGVQIYLSFLFK
jgi:hypothetical protein